MEIHFCLGLEKKEIVIKKLPVLVTQVNFRIYVLPVEPDSSPCYRS